MKLLFAHDHRFHYFNGNYYSNGSFSKEALERYTKVFEEVTFVSRHVTAEIEPTNMSLASTERVTFKEVPNFKSIKSYIKKGKAAKIIEGEVKSADYVISRMPSDVGSIAIKLAKKHNKPYLIEVVTCPWDALWNHSMLGKALAPKYYFDLKKVVKEAPYVIYVTKEFLQKRYPTNGKNVNCSNVALVEFQDDILQKRNRKIVDHSGKTIIGTTAAIDVKFKGQQYIIEALGKLKQGGFTNYEYQLVGSGDSAFLKSVADKYDVLDQVKFLGSLPHEKVFEWLDTIDLYVQPSRQEGLPRALIEAMSRAVPAFGAKTAGIPELLERECIFSNSSKNIDEICAILKTMSQDRMLELAKKNFNEAKKYSKNIIEKRRMEFLREFKEASLYEEQ